MENSETDTTPLSLPANIFFVSNSGSNEADGSETSPWQSLQYAVSQLRAGDTLFIQEGIYQENIRIAASGSLTDYITIEGVGNVILDGQTFEGTRSGIETEGRDFIRLKNLSFRNFKAAVDVEASSIFIEIDGIQSEDNDYAVRITDAEHITVRNAVARRSKNAFRATGNSRDLLFEDIEAYESKDIFEGMNPDYLNGDGFILESNVSDVIIRNVVSANHWDAGFDIKAANVLIENAESYGNKNNFKIWGSNITIRSSLSRQAKRQPRTDGTTVEGNGITVNGGGEVRLVNVTLADNEDHDIRIYSGGSLRAENSIVARKVTGGMLFENSGNYSGDRVLWHSVAADFSVLPIFPTDLRVNPGFVDWNAGDYHLTQASEAVDFSESADELPALDLDRQARIAGLRADLGAFEFQGHSVALFDGIANGNVAAGTLKISPNRTTFPALRGAAYFLDGKKIFETTKSPFALGGSKGFNTLLYPDGSHLLTVVLQIDKRRKETHLIAFMIANHTDPLLQAMNYFQVSALQQSPESPRKKKSKSKKK